MKMSSKFTCRFCKEQFDVPKGLYKHLQTAHNAGASRDNRTCPICGVLCSKYEGYRDHLLYIHGQTNDGQKLTFKSLNEFLFWKTELEMKHNCKYVLQSAPKVLPTKEKKYFYQCDRSDSKSKDRRDKKAMSVVMKTCSSVISVVEGTGLFKVEYWDTHSGHAESSTVQLTQNELEAAISSVEMVNAIDSDDSFDRSASLILSNNSNSPVSVVEKPNILQKANLNNLKTSPLSKIIQKKTSLLTSKIDTAKKKSSNTSILYSLASVACGKGIAKKPVNKLKDSKESENTGQIDACADTTISETPESESLPEKNVPAQTTSFCTATPTVVTSSVTTVSSLPSTTKATSSGLPAIAPKITVANTNTISPLFTSNNAFSNQFVIMNPMSLDQNSINSGQNILLSLGPLGQNVLPNSSTPQTIAVKDNCSVSGANVTISKVNTPGKVKTSKIMTSSTNAISSATSPIVSSSTISLPAGINNAPVILSSLPVGSTFMSVNNNLIPIASPSGAFIPTSLPPNIVLTPVLQNSTPSSKDLKSSANVVIAPQSSQVRLSAPPQSLSITVSSIVKEPVYSYSSVKNVTSTLTTSISSPLSASALANSKAANKGQFKFVPITAASNRSPLANVSRSATSNNILPNSAAVINQSSSKTMGVDSDSESSLEKSLGDTPQKKPSARKRITRKPALPVKSPGLAAPNSLPAKNISISNSPVAPSIPNLGMKLVNNSQLSITPISSTPGVSTKPQQMSKPFHQPILFESSGEVYMLQPVENEAVGNSMSKIVSNLEFPKAIKIDRSVQTTEISNAVALKSKLQRKRAAPPTDDSAVMLKVKCYQLEMKYLSTQTECKRLKVELTKEKLKNAELCGETANMNIDEDHLSETNRNKAQEIMKEIEDKFSGNKDEQHIYTMTKTSVLRSLYEDLEGLCNENSELHKELENYRNHDKFYKNLKKRLDDEDF